MSVPVGERKPNKMEVFIKAQDLCIHTIKICKNPKVFLPEYQNALTNDIIKCSKDIFICAWEANNIRVTTKEEYLQRLDLQNKSIRECINLLALMQIAQGLFHLPLRRVKFWGEKAVNTKSLLIAWRNSDKERYSNL